MVVIAVDAVAQELARQISTARERCGGRQPRLELEGAVDLGDLLRSIVNLYVAQVVRQVARQCVEMVEQVVDEPPYNCKVVRLYERSIDDEKTLAMEPVDLLLGQRHPSRHEVLQTSFLGNYDVESGALAWSGSKRYPMPGSVKKYCGWLGCGSSLRRTFAMCTRR